MLDKVTAKDDGMENNTNMRRPTQTNQMKLLMRFVCCCCQQNFDNNINPLLRLQKYGEEKESRENETKRSMINGMVNILYYANEHHTDRLPTLRGHMRLETSVSLSFAHYFTLHFVAESRAQFTKIFLFHSSFHLNHSRFTAACSLFVDLLAAVCYPILKCCRRWFFSAIKYIVCM